MYFARKLCLTITLISVFCLMFASSGFTDDSAGDSTSVDSTSVEPVNVDSSSSDIACNWDGDLMVNREVLEWQYMTHSGDIVDSENHFFVIASRPKLKEIFLHCNESSGITQTRQDIFWGSWIPEIEIPDDWSWDPYPSSPPGM